MSFLHKTVKHKQKSKHASDFMFKARNSEFWRWDLPENIHYKLYKSGTCGCFNCLIKWPTKGDSELPLFDYEYDLFKAMFPAEKTVLARELQLKNNAYLIQPPKPSHFIYVKKAAGLGITTFYLRLMYWLICRRNEMYRGREMVIVTGSRIELSIDLISRLKALVPEGVPFAETKETVFHFSGCTVVAYPSSSQKALRGGLPAFALCDEADFFAFTQQQEARTVLERYAGKVPDYYLVLISTPNRPFGLFYEIEYEPANTCLYHRFYLSWEVGYHKIYSEKDIELAKRSKSFPREYGLSYFADIQGAVFPSEEIDAACKLGEILGDPTTLDESILLRDNPAAKETRYMAVDPAYGSSNYAWVICQINHGCLQFTFADDINRPAFDFSISRTLYLFNYFNCKSILIDSSAPAVISALKKAVGDRMDYLTQIDELKHTWKVDADDVTQLARYMRIVPVNFNQHRGKTMLNSLAVYISGGSVAIHPNLKKMVYALRGATISGESGLLDKQVSPHNDITDCARMITLAYKQNRINEK